MLARPFACGGKLAGDVADGFAGSDESCDDFILLRRTWMPIIAQVLRICARQQVSSKPRAWAVAAATPQERGPIDGPDRGPVGEPSGPGPPPQVGSTDVEIPGLPPITVPVPGPPPPAEPPV